MESNTKPSAALLGLPNELLDQILAEVKWGAAAPAFDLDGLQFYENLTHNTDTASIQRVRLACRRLASRGSVLLLPVASVSISDPASVDRLEQIAGLGGLAPYVKAVHVYFDFYRADLAADIRLLAMHLMQKGPQLFVESTMLFGMGMTLTPEEDALLADVVRPCYAALALANDYFSFDREWAEIQTNPVGGKPINAVWLYMQWRGLDAPIAKRLVTEAANRYETRFLELCEQFRRQHAPVSPKLDVYLRALSYQVSGNVVWSLNCPRYHPEFRYDPNAGVEDAMTAEQRG
ncbi:isoprenoid synthase domain-containing protein [Parachaetomium inaequale]|uniref:Isoprenoid synthase domain-containing protein n=1 Tax=Parachaetomium inaequale TaxID=2588326 RepID=A0AAN6SKS2_9PEZI|nr:isoprenoid synthase domain-containing protein [Parachaetomium inaequale]